jgi:hypothetical protein
VDTGRGFVLRDSDGRRLIITAAHCLPFLPPSHSKSYLEERTYRSLIAPLGKPPDIWAQCLFVDPVADIAVLGPPDDQQLSEQQEAYVSTVRIRPLSVSDPRPDMSVWLLLLKGELFQCRFRYFGRPGFYITDAAQDIEPGTSGSPILADDGSAVGVVCVAGYINESGVRMLTECGPQPVLTQNLPGWLCCRRAWPRKSRKEEGNGQVQ